MLITKIKKTKFFFLSVLLFIIYSMFFTSVKAEKVCQVTDPTGTPLNVRDTPNGRIINALKNGREVSIEQIEYDKQGRPWALVGGYYQGKYKVWGWVIREFISCYERSR